MFYKHLFLVFYFPGADTGMFEAYWNNNSPDVHHQHAGIFFGCHYTHPCPTGLLYTGTLFSCIYGEMCMLTKLVSVYLFH